MEDITLALVTLTAFVLLFVVAIFADRAGHKAAQTSDTNNAVALKSLVTEKGSSVQSDELIDDANVA